MSVIRNLLSDIPIPENFYRIKYHLVEDHIEDVAEAVREALRRPGTLDRIPAGARVCITSSSREINNIALITRTLVEELKRVGAKPFVIPGMGSHGGALAEGQLHLLEKYGVTEETVGCPILSDMTTYEVGKSPDGYSVHVSKDALEADCIIPLGRIKGHTDFHGPVESGIQKMMVIGLGKQHGADSCHALGFEKMSENVQKFAKVILDNCNIAFGFGIIENAFHGTYKLAAIPAEKIQEEEPALLLEAKELMPVVPFEKVDVCMVEQAGKDISGNGMDPNVMGRTMDYERSKPFIDKIGLLDLSPKTGGQFNGTAAADCITKHMFEKFDFEETFPNNITANATNSGRISIVMPTDKLCMQFCLKTYLRTDPVPVRLVWIKDTLHIGEFFASEGLYEEAMANEKMDVEQTPYELIFDDKEELFQGFKNKETGEMVRF